MYKDGLARFATMKYHDPTAGNLVNIAHPMQSGLVPIIKFCSLVYSHIIGYTYTVQIEASNSCFSIQSKQCMHLTNYAINKHSKDFVRDDDSGSKRRITTVNQWFVDNGYDLKKIWNDIDVSSITEGVASGVWSC